MPEETGNGTGPKKRVDEAWKEEIQREKEKQRKEEPAKSRAADAGPYRKLDFPAFLSSLAGETLVLLGAIPDPLTGKTGTNLRGARTTIDTLDMLREKTSGNLTPEETALFDNLLQQLRMRYVQAATASSGGDKSDPATPGTASD